MRHTLLSILVLATSAAAISAQTNVSFELKLDSAASSETPLRQADFNNDGKPDLVYGSDSGSDVMIRIGNGDGTFQAPVKVGTADAQIDEVQAGDFDHDGNADIAVGTFQGTFDVFFGTGNGTFSPPIATASTGGSVMAIGDFNGDHLLDVAIGGNNGVMIYNNVGGRNFILKETVQPESGHEVTSLGIGDFDDDGIQSIAVTTSFDNQGAGANAYLLWNDGNENFSSVLLKTFGYPAKVTVADLNQDGMDDVVLSYDCNPNNQTAGRQDPTPCQGVLAVYGQGQHKLFQRSLISATGYSQAEGLLTADGNGDGIADVVTVGRVSTTNWGLFVFLGHPDGSYDQTAQQFIASTDGVLSSVAADFNRDGMMDFVAFAGGTQIFLNATNRAPCATSQINPTVTVCAPVEGTYAVGPSVHVQANAYDSRQVTALQLYTNGTLAYSQPGTSFSQNFTMNPGGNLLVLKAWDATGLSFRSQRHINVYSGTPGSVCPAALGAASICLPSGAAGPSPVHIVGNGYTANVPTSAQLYIDGNEVLVDNGCSNGNVCEGGSSALDTYQNLGTGMHDLVFKLWDSKGNVYSAEKSVTVQ